MVSFTAASASVRCRQSEYSTVRCVRLAGDKSKPRRERRSICADRADLVSGLRGLCEAARTDFGEHWMKAATIISMVASASETVTRDVQADKIIQAIKHG